MEIYLDHAATTPPLREEVLAEMLPYLVKNLVMPPVSTAGVGVPGRHWAALGIGWHKS